MSIFNAVEIAAALKAGSMFLVKDVLLTKEQYEEYAKAKKDADYYDMLQGVRKVQLNSTYGALLNAYMRFGDPRLGASVTFTGRQITTHMVETTTAALGTMKTLDKTVNHVKKKKRDGTIDEKIENEYTLVLEPHEAGAIYSDTDSVAGDSQIELDGRRLTIADAFTQLAHQHPVVEHGTKQFVYSSLKSPCFVDGKIVQSEIQAIYRHRVSKRMFEITTSSGKKIKVTEDHSVMVLENGQLVEKKPTELTSTSICISINRT